MEDRDRISPLQQMIASSCGAMLTSLFVTPLDVVKIRLQAQERPLKAGECFIMNNGLMEHVCTCENGDACKEDVHWYKKRIPGPKLTGTADAMIRIARHEGIPSLWSGLSPTLVMAVPATMLYFTVYDQLKYKMGYREDNRKTAFVPVLAGMSARVLTTTVVSPLELIRTKKQSQHLSYGQLGLAVRGAMKHGGVLSLWQGLGPSLLRDVPFSGIYWCSYEIFKTLIAGENAREPSFWQAFASGAISGTIAGVLTLPFDVVKTHRQIEMGDMERKGQMNKVTTSTLKLLMEMRSKKGYNSWFTGIVPRVVKVAPACAIMIGSYEYAKLFFKKTNAARRHVEEELDHASSRSWISSDGLFKSSVAHTFQVNAGSNKT
ncbi:solute carrier family 25 member 40 [Lingula anatina]|uniref:Solute carrier family 25 member 40 n=1 Tax=Lingula anatina TaxID=7574 RepID=A0A1S3HB66_LINAN|nr:solute carrier family 25 member 40 [Lingula anatina]|eukprot:XP_013382394.1 solute carrier family 25 member 40 [Lingula anatina]